ncbi:MAG TPA: cytochrome c oxidase subunit 3 [Opitutaceae bacterium]|nr:cytochrome c oxidase subunit 3 [Opitutaceae bacterium]
MSVAAATLDHHGDPSTATGIPNKKLLLWAFLASDCMFFGTLISTHLVYRLHPPPGNPVPTQIFNIELTSFSTFILLMSSLMMALAVNAIQRGKVRSMRSSLLVTISFGLIFLGCQVFEFNDFVFEKHVTITNSIFGSTFFTLTGTHGTHVAIGVLWLTLMYIRSFKPAAAVGGGWVGRAVLHLLVFAVAVLLAIYAVLGFAHAALATGINGTMLAAYGRSYGIAVAGTLLGMGGLRWFGREHGPVDFDAGNANDVESMGLYWHFVDIVWIVIFTAVYLLEYVYPAGPVR